MAERAERRHKQSASRMGDARGEFRKDQDRLYYTPALRRLTGVTQVAAPSTEVALIHNRYVHSDKVAQIGRSLAEYLLVDADPSRVDAVGGLSPDVVAAAGLAHDIGHPPFGHAGEVALSRCAVAGGLDGFEGNAQTFRILTKLAIKDETFLGLDLTRASRNAVLKYPWTYGSGETDEHRAQHKKKWCVYRTEVPDFDEAREIHRLPDTGDGQASQSIEARVMELADDISYALHDFEDFYRVGLISLSKFREAYADDGEFRERVLASVAKGLHGAYDEQWALDAWKRVLDFFDNSIFKSLRTAYEGSREQDAALTRLVSFQISQFVRGISLDVSSGVPVVVEPAVEHAIALWKEMTRQYVINEPGFGTVQRGQTKVLERTLEALVNHVSDVAVGDPDKAMGSPTLPRRLRDYYWIGRQDQDDPEPGGDPERILLRATIDYIASLTEPQLMVLHDQLTGVWQSGMIGVGVL